MDDKTSRHTSKQASQPLIPTGITNLPLLEIFSRDVSLNKTLALKIDTILAQRLKNEITIAEALHEGLTTDQVCFADAVKMHNGSKDSLSDLIKIKQLLGGLPTESKSVVHTFDKAALLDVVRAVRQERVARRSTTGEVGSSDEVMEGGFADG